MPSCWSTKPWEWGAGEFSPTSAPGGGSLGPETSAPTASRVSSCHGAPQRHGAFQGLRRSGQGERVGAGSTESKEGGGGCPGEIETTERELTSLPG